MEIHFKVVENAVTMVTGTRNRLGGSFYGVGDGTMNEQKLRYESGT